MDVACVLLEYMHDGCSLCALRVHAGMRWPRGRACRYGLPLIGGVAKGRGGRQDVDRRRREGFLLVTTYNIVEGYSSPCWFVALRERTLALGPKGEEYLGSAGKIY